VFQTVRLTKDILNTSEDIQYIAAIEYGLKYIVYFFMIPKTIVLGLPAFVCQFAKLIKENLDGGR
jgi:hypothetical protein